MLLMIELFRENSYFLTLEVCVNIWMIRNWSIYFHIVCRSYLTVLATKATNSSVCFCFCFFFFQIATALVYLGGSLWSSSVSGCFRVSPELVLHSLCTGPAQNQTVSYINIWHRHFSGLGEFSPFEENLFLVSHTRARRGQFGNFITIWHHLKTKTNKFHIREVL